MSVQEHDLSSCFQNQFIKIDLVTCDEVDSTNDVLRRLLEKKLPSKTALLQSVKKNPSCSVKEISFECTGAPSSRVAETKQHTVMALMARRQTKGRGRFGRTWISPPGGLYLSLAVDVEAASYRVAALSLVVALALRLELTKLLQQANGQKILQKPVGKKRQAAEYIKLQELTRTSRQHEAQTVAAPHKAQIQVKWPNDLIVTQGKLVGILVESIQLVSGQRWAIIGVGVNIRPPGINTNTPAAKEPSAENRAAYLSDLTHSLPDHDELAVGILKSILSYYGKWHAGGCSFASFREEYNAYLNLVRQRVTVRNDAKEILAEGRVEGVDGEGSLLLRDDTGQRVTIAAGEVTLRT